MTPTHQLELGGIPRGAAPTFLLTSGALSDLQAAQYRAEKESEQIHAAVSIIKTTCLTLGCLLRYHRLLARSSRDCEGPMEPVLLDPRDPWTDPRVGDIFVRDNEARVVTGFAPGAPVIVIKNRRGSPRGHSFDTPECWDAWASWWAWASGARVIRAVRMGHFHEVDPYERDIPFYAIRPVKAKSGGMLPAAWESLAADCVEVEVIDAHLGRKWVLVCRNVVFPTNPKQIRKKL